MPGTDLELILFSTDPAVVTASLAAGIDSFICDWEYREKEVRQAGTDTEINRESPADLRRLTAAGAPRRYCRINSFGAATPAEIETAIGAGATHLMLPMVTGTAQVKRYLDCVAGRAKAGILVENQQAVERLDSLALLPVDFVYIGLNDLMISRGSKQLFAPLLDGTVGRVREAFEGRPLGFGGLTVLDGGSPVPCRYLLGEMARLDCSFTFLRRSFRRDIGGRDLPLEISRLRDEWRRLQARTGAEKDADRLRLRTCLQQAYDG